MSIDYRGNFRTIPGLRHAGLQEPQPRTFPTEGLHSAEYASDVTGFTSLEYISSSRYAMGKEDRSAFYKDTFGIIDFMKTVVANRFG
jgi:hypothetical protein